MSRLQKNLFLFVSSLFFSYNLSAVMTAEDLDLKYEDLKHLEKKFQQKVNKAYDACCTALELKSKAPAEEWQESPLGQGVPTLKQAVDAMNKAFTLCYDAQESPFGESLSLSQKLFRNAYQKQLESLVKNEDGSLRNPPPNWEEFCNENPTIKQNHKLMIVILVYCFRESLEDENFLKEILHSIAWHKKISLAKKTGLGVISVGGVAAFCWYGYSRLKNKIFPKPASKKALSEVGAANEEPILNK